MSNSDTNDTSLPGWLAPMIRNVLAIVAGFVIGRGWFTAEQWASVSGGAVALAGFLWTVYSRAQTRKKLASAIAAPAGAAK